MSHQARSDDEVLLARLRSGDEAAFVQLVDGLHGRLIAFARTFTSSPALAEDIVQETWIGVIRGLRIFEGRSTLRTWIFGILVRRARTLAVRWLVEFARNRRERSMAQRLANELLDAQSQQGGAYKRKDDIFRMAQANKAFAHYRW